MDKVMAQVSGQVGREVPVTRDIDTTAVAGDYHDFPGSTTKAYAQTYASRMGTIEAALGNKDQARG